MLRRCASATRRLPLVLLPLAVLLGLAASGRSQAQPVAQLLADAQPGTGAAQGVVSMATAPFPNFESGAVRPLLLSPDGGRLCVLNTADHRVEVFDTAVDAAGVPHLAYRGAVFTGLEPVSMTLHPDDPDTLFVANLLSDSVSVVDLLQMAVLDTIKAGDEPQDLLVAGDKLFIATARSAEVPDFITPGAFVENALVVAQAAPPYAILQRLELPGHKPRALAAAAGSVWVIPQNSGNHTTALDAFQTSVLGLDQLDLDAFDQPFTVNPALLLPVFLTTQFLNFSFGTFGWAIPPTGRIVFDSEYPGLVPQLQDADVIGVDPASLTLLPPPTTGVGGTLFAIAANPVTGKLWVANTHALNRTRFEPAVSGAAFENRVTILQPGGAVEQVIRLEPPATSAPHAQPVALAFHIGVGGGGGSGGAGPLAYVACLGDASVTVLDGVSGAVVQELATGELPQGLAVDEARALLYVFTRGDKRVAAYDIAQGHAPIGRPAALSYDPEPQGVVAGRTHLYDARPATGAGTGNLSCASCHVFGHLDQLAWDLGDPGGGLGYFSPDLMTGVLGFNNQQVALKSSLMTHPMKGPMVTQSLRGLSDSAATPLHWRGDRRFFQNFRGAFVGLLGGGGISPVAMQQYATFVSSLAHPPNPHQPRDRAYSGEAAAGRDLFGMNPAVPGKEYNADVPGNVTCVDCHTGDFSGKTNFTGAQATVNFDGESQLFNTAQLRGVYEKDFAHLTGFGTLHDGSLDDILEFLSFEPLPGQSAFPLLTATDREQVADFVRAWDTGLSPLVGDQFTATPDDNALLYEWLDLAELEAVAPASNVDLIGKALFWWRGGSLAFGLRFGLEPVSDSHLYQLDNGAWVTRSTLVGAIASGRLAITFTCVPPGMGLRLGVDRDEDGLLDGLEPSAGSSPDAPDTDGDGYADPLELLLGSHPAVPDAFLPGDATPPGVTLAEARDVFADTATLHVVTDEPADTLVEIGTIAGSYDLLAFTDPTLRSAHDVTLSGLPAGTELFFRVTAADRNGNAGSAEGSFQTTPPLYSVADITLVKQDAGAGAGPFTLTATVLVHDHTGAPVVDAPVRGLWAGAIGTADFFPLQRTDTAGIATFTVGPYTPTAPTVVTFSPAYVGTTTLTDPFAIGLGGSTPKFFYNQPANAENHASVGVP